MASHSIIVEMLQHTTSPLTSALTIFFTYKVSHIPKMKVYIRASSILFKEWRRNRGALPPPAAVSTSSLDSGKRTPKGPPGAPHQAAGVLGRSSHTVVTSPLGPLAWARASAAAPGARFGTSRRAVSTVPLSVGAGLTAALGTVPAAATEGAAATSLAQTFVASSVAADASAAVSGAADLGHAATEASSSFLSFFMTTGPLTGNSVPLSVAFFENLIGYFHASGLNWGVAIVSATLVFRVLVLPLNVSLVRNTARLFLIRSQIAELRHTMEKGTHAMQVQAARDFFAVLKRGKANPFKNLVSPILFPPIFLSLFGAVHGLCTTVPDLKNGGALWFHDLTLPDTSGVLPVLSALTWLATIELASGKAFHMPLWMLSATRLLAVACIPITEPLPAGVFMFWLTSNLFAMGRATMLRQRPIARFFGVPPVNRPSDH